MRINRIRRDITVLGDELEVPGIGHLPVNAYVLHAAEPVVVDTGLSLPGRGFMDALGSVLDPADVEWIWLTHPDRDHTGALFDLLDAAPRARLITTFAGIGIMSCARPVPMDRVYLLNPGQSLDVGDRTLTALRPPRCSTIPAPSASTTTAARPASRRIASGAPMETAELATANDVGYSAPRRRPRRAAPVGHRRQSLGAPGGRDEVPAHRRRGPGARPAMDPQPPTSPPADGRTAEFLDMLAEAPKSDPFIGPDQAALEQMLAGFEPVA